MPPIDGKKTQVKPPPASAGSPPGSGRVAPPGVGPLAATSQAAALATTTFQMMPPTLGKLIASGIRAMNLGLGLGLGLHDIPREEILEHVFRRATAMGKVIYAQVGEYAFKYALVFSEDGYGRPRRDEHHVNEMAMSLLQKEEDTTCGTAVEASATIVYGKSVPQPFRHLVGLHEWVEANGGTHRDAVYVELSEARKLPYIYPRYAQWIYDMTLAAMREGTADRGYMGRAVPGFVEKHDPHQYGPTAYVELFYQALLSEMGVSSPAKLHASGTSLPRISPLSFVERRLIDTRLAEGPITVDSIPFSVVQEYLAKVGVGQRLARMVDPLHAQTPFDVIGSVGGDKVKGLHLRYGEERPSGEMQLHARQFQLHFEPQADGRVLMTQAVGTRSEELARVIQNASHPIERALAVEQGVIPDHGIEKPDSQLPTVSELLEYLVRPGNVLTTVNPFGEKEQWKVESPRLFILAGERRGQQIHNLRVIPESDIPAFMRSDKAAKSFQLLFRAPPQGQHALTEVYGLGSEFPGAVTVSSRRSVIPFESGEMSFAEWITLVGQPERMLNVHHDAVAQMPMLAQYMMGMGHSPDIRGRKDGDVVRQLRWISPAEARTPLQDNEFQLSYYRYDNPTMPYWKLVGAKGNFGTGVLDMVLSANGISAASPPLLAAMVGLRYQVAPVAPVSHPLSELAELFTPASMDQFVKIGRGVALVFNPALDRFSLTTGPVPKDAAGITISRGPPYNVTANGVKEIGDRLDQMAAEVFMRLRKIDLDLFPSPASKLMVRDILNHNRRGQIDLATFCKFLSDPQFMMNFAHLERLSVGDGKPIQVSGFLYGGHVSSLEFSDNITERSQYAIGFRIVLKYMADGSHEVLSHDGEGARDVIEGLEIASRGYDLRTLGPVKQAMFVDRKGSPLRIKQVRQYLEQEGAVTRLLRLGGITDPQVGATYVFAGSNDHDDPFWTTPERARALPPYYYQLHFQVQPDHSLTMTYAAGKKSAVLRTSAIKGGIPSVPEVPKTREQLIGDLKAMAMTLGRSLVGRDIYAMPGMATIEVYKEVFGSWSRALTAAGLTPCKTTPKSSPGFVTVEALAAPLLALIDGVMYCMTALHNAGRRLPLQGTVGTSHLWQPPVTAGAIPNMSAVPARPLSPLTLRPLRLNFPRLKVLRLPRLR